MRPAVGPKGAPVPTEQIILFRVSGELLAVSSSAVQEVRSADSLSGASSELSHPHLRKVTHVVHRSGKALYVVSGAAHFGLPPAPAALVFILRDTRAAVLIDGIEKMASMTRLQALPRAFCHEERQWYRGLTALDQSVTPVVAPDGFLTAEEISLLDAFLNSDEKTQPGSATASGGEWRQ